MDKTGIFLDNGVSGAITILHSDNSIDYFKTPIKRYRNYQKTKEQYLNRVDVTTLMNKISKAVNPSFVDVVLMERPMVNLGRFNASMSAIRALEASLIAFELLKLPECIYVDSKMWQSVMLPNIEGSEELKKASLALGKQLYPKIKFKKDADSLLMALWYKNYVKK